MPLSDQKARTEALSPQQSFIVQAPAGSGKTELLIQRYLMLLTQVKHPEAVLAITFTRKAATEMRHRVIQALQDTDNTLSATEQTILLAQQVRNQDIRFNWNLTENTQKLQIMTIDAFCSQLIKKAPFSSKKLVHYQLVENAEIFYEEAVTQILQSSAIEPLLLHLENRVDTLKILLIESLKKRAQWLPHLIPYQADPHTLRKKMETLLKTHISETLSNVKTAIPANTLQTLQTLMAHAASYFKKNNIAHPLQNYLFSEPLAAQHEEAHIWQGLCNLLLTQSGNFRNTLTKKEGFAAGTPEKKQLLEIIETLKSDEQLRKNLLLLRKLPSATYNKKQWEIVCLLITLLPKLAATLDVVFSTHEVMDFVALNLAALDVLGENTDPTQLALQLDYTLSHLLVDEFQDTSLLQMCLLQTLTENWTADGSKTVFLVGDPMQSIYRFRNAEVGFFLSVQQSGLGDLPLKSLYLSENFRSLPGLVQWNNACFKKIFPKKAEYALGSAPFTPAVSHKNTQSTQNTSVTWHLTRESEKESASQKILDTLHMLQKNFPHDSIALLVRSRTHLTEIMPYLNQHKLAYHATEILPLLKVEIIQELHCLSRALLHRFDHTAWLSVLRAPYCGIRLAGLTQITEIFKDKHISLFTQMQEGASPLWEQLDTDTHIRLRHLFTIIKQSYAELHKISFSQVLQKTWQKLGGNHLVLHTQDQNALDTYFELLEKIAQDRQGMLTIEVLESELSRHYADAVCMGENSPIHIMTIHKAKGLEFDHVLLPELQRKPAQNGPELLKWHTPLDPKNPRSAVLLAPIYPKYQTADPLYAYLDTQEKILLENEAKRLLYVATTRAKISLHLFGTLKIQKGSAARPPEKSFLAYFSEINAITNLLPPPSTPDTEHAPPNSTAPSIRKLTLERFRSCHFPPIAQHSATQPITSFPIEKKYENTAPSYASALYKFLCLRAYNKTPLKKSLLLTRLPTLHSVEHLGDTLYSTLTHIEQETTAQWIFSSKKLPTPSMTYITEKKKICYFQADVCFISKNTLWAVLFLTGDNTTPLSHKQHYVLPRYKRFLEISSPYPVKIGLYYPLHSAWQVILP